MPTAARLALPVNVFVAHMVDSFMMMMLLSIRFHFSIGMPHHPAFGKLLSCGSLPLIGAKFRYLSGIARKGCHYISFVQILPGGFAAPEHAADGSDNQA